jgi:hypothetical protein
LARQGVHQSLRPVSAGCDAHADEPLSYSFTSGIPTRSTQTSTGNKCKDDARAVKSGGDRGPAIIEILRRTPIPRARGAWTRRFANLPESAAAISGESKARARAVVLFSRRKTTPLPPGSRTHDSSSHEARNHRTPNVGIAIRRCLSRAAGSEGSCKPPAT